MKRLFVAFALIAVVFAGCAMEEDDGFGGGGGSSAKYTIFLTLNWWTTDQQAKVVELFDGQLYSNEMTLYSSDEVKALRTALTEMTSTKNSSYDYTESQLGTLTNAAYGNNPTMKEGFYKQLNHSGNAIIISADGWVYIETL